MALSGLDEVKIELEKLDRVNVKIPNGLAYIAEVAPCSIKDGLANKRVKAIARNGRFGAGVNVCVYFPRRNSALHHQILNITVPVEAFTQDTAPDQLKDITLELEE